MRLAFAGISQLETPSCEGNWPQKGEDVLAGQLKTVLAVLLQPN